MIVEVPAPRLLSQDFVSVRDIDHIIAELLAWLLDDMITDIFNI